MGDIHEWFRFYRNAKAKAKIRRLPPKLFKQWVLLLCCTDDDGRLEDLDDAAEAMRMTVSRLKLVLTQLAAHRLFDKTRQGWVAHNWPKHQYKSDHSGNRVRAFRKRQRNVTVTPPETETETEVPDPPTSDQADKSASVKPLQAKQAYLDAPPKQRVAMLVGLGDALGFQRKGGLTAAINRDYGYDPQRIVDVMTVALSKAKGDPWKYVTVTLGEMEARDGGSGRTRGPGAGTRGAGKGTRRPTGQAQGWDKVEREMAMGAGDAETG